MTSHNEQQSSSQGGSRRQQFFLIVVLALVVIGGGAYGLYGWQELKNDREGLVAHGNVDIRQVELGFRVSGRIAEMKFEEGDQVKANNVVAVLDKTPFVHELASAKAAAQQAEASIQERQAAYENAIVYAERQKALMASDSIAAQDYDNAAAQLKQVTAQLANAKAALASATARVATAETNLADTEILAPNDGVIFTRAREPGAIVATGASVYTLSLHHPIWVRAYVAEPDLGRIKPGMEVHVETDTKGNPLLKGQIGFISPQAEFTPKNIETKELRTDLVYRIRVLVEDDQGLLRQGMPVTVTILTDKRT